MMRRQLISWRALFPVIFLFTMIAGFISNLLYPASLPFLFKDILIIFVALVFFISEDWGIYVSGLRRRIGAFAWLAASVFVALCVGQIFNPLSPGLLLGLLGFKIYFLYWVLALLGYAYVDSVETVRKWIGVVLLFSIPTNLFGIYQFFAGPDFLVSKFGIGFSRAVIYAHIYGAEAGESFLRIIGTFPSTGQYTHFLIINSLLCFAYLFSSRKSAHRIIAITAAVIAFTALIMTGSRAGIIILACCMGAYALFSRKSRPVIFAAIIISATLYVAFNSLGTGVAKRYKTLSDVETITERGIQTPTRMFFSLIDRHPMGQGLGSASTGAKHLPGLEKTTRIYVENYPAKLQAETGLAGVFLFFIFICLLMLRWRRSWLTHMNDEMLNIAVPLTAYCFVVFTVMAISGVIDSSPIPIFQWCFVGMVARLADLADDAYYSQT